MRQQMAVRAREGDAERVGKRAGNHDPVEESWQRIGELRAAVRAARASIARSPHGHTEGLDEMLLAHHRGFPERTELQLLDAC